MLTRKEMIEELVCLYCGEDAFDPGRYVISAVDEAFREETYCYYDSMSDSELYETYRKEFLE